jgi:hypothetical protein
MNDFTQNVKNLLTLLQVMNAEAVGNHPKWPKSNHEGKEDGIIRESVVIRRRGNFFV